MGMVLTQSAQMIFSGVRVNQTIPAKISECSGVPYKWATALPSVAPINFS
jgi:hypothetical protein